MTLVKYCCIKYRCRGDLNIKREHEKYEIKMQYKEMDKQGKISIYREISCSKLKTNDRNTIHRP